MLMISSIIQALFKIKIQSSMSEQEKKQQRIYDLLKNQAKFFLSTLYKAKKNFFYCKRTFSGKWGVEVWTKNEKNAFNLSCCSD